MTAKKKLSDFGENVFSQYGEDGVIEKIFSIIKPKSKVVCEIGAWDGLLLSNSANLWKNKGWKGVLIEASESKFRELVENTKDAETVNILAMVTPKGKNSIDRLFEARKLETEIDLLSIDIDGDDYYLFESLKKVKPRVVVIEFNATIPWGVDLKQKPGGKLGASAFVLVELAKKKGYELVGMTQTNVFLVNKKEAAKFAKFEINGREIFPNNHLTYVISDYQGGFGFSNKPVYGCGYVISDEVDGKLYKPSITTWLNKTKMEAIKWVKGDEVQGKNRLELVEDEARRLVRKTPLVDWLRQRMDAEKMKQWQEAGKPTPPPYAYKQKRILALAEKHELETFVETGTYYGETTVRLRNKFGQLYTIELDKRLAARAKERFGEYGNIEVIQGDSGNELPKLIKRLDEPGLFFLDGHYCSGVSARGKKDSPVLDELKAIFGWRDDFGAIVIDDARHFGVSRGYPTIEEITKLVENRAPGYKIRVKHDLIEIEPNNE